MIRSLQASFRQLRGLNISDRKHKIWIKYFTLKTQKIISSLPKKSDLNAHYLNFNFGDVNEKMLYTEGESVEENPEAALPVLFNFQQPISKHYFDFCKLLSAEKSKLNDFRVIIFEIHPHLMRCLIAFIYQFKNELDKLIIGKETAFFPRSFAENFPYLVEMLLSTPPEIRCDFLFLFSIYEKLISEKLSQIICQGTEKNSFAKSIYQIFNHLIDFFKSDGFDFEESMTSLSFVINYFFETFNFNKESELIKKTFPMFCTMLAKSDKLRKLIEPKTYTKLFELSSIILSYISSLDDNVNRNEYVDVALPILQMFISMMPANRELISPTVGAHGIMSPIVKLVEWVAKTDLPNDIEIPNLEEKKEARTPHAEVMFEFIEENLIDKDEFERDKTKDAKKLSQIQPTYLQNSPLIIKLLYKITGICSKDKSMLSDFIVTISYSFTETNSLKIQYIGTFGLFTTQSKDFAETMDKTDSWQYFVTPTIFNKYTLTGKCSEHLISLKDMVLSFTTIAFTSKYHNKTSLLNAFGRLMTANSPILIEKITEFFNNLIHIDYNVFVDCVVKTNIIDNLFSAYIQFRAMSRKDPTDKSLIAARTQIAIFIREIMDKEKPCTFMYKTSLRSNTLVSLIFEEVTYRTAIDIITLCLSTIKSGDFIKYITSTMKVGLMNAEHPRWIRFFHDIINKFIDACRFNAKNIIKLFRDDGCLSTFCSVPATYVDANNKEEATSLIKVVLKLIVLICKNEPSFQETLSSSSEIIKGNIEKTLKYITIDDDVVNLLLSLATNDDVIIATASRFGEISCNEGLQLLYSAVEETDYLKVIINFLAEITKNSINNRYMCFRSNIIQSLIKLIPQNHSPTVMQLFSQLGASFFRMGELSMTIRLLKNVKQDYVLPLLQSLITMTEQKDPLEPKALFHLGKGVPVFSVPEFPINKHFTISALFNFEVDAIEQSQRQVPLMNIVAGKQRIDFMIYKKNIVMTIKDTKRIYEFVLFDKVPANVWQLYTFAIEPKHIYAYINKQLINDFELENRFKFSSNVTLSICGAKVNIEKIFVYNTAITPQTMNLMQNDEENTKKLQQIAYFSANKFLNERCINQITNSSIGSATFNGLVVPFSISLIDAIPTCGGPNILLPLLELTEESLEPSKYLIKVLTLIGKVAKANQQMFVGQRFFRSLGHILLTLNKEIVTEEIIDELYITYRDLSIPSLKREMIRYVWGDFAIWTHMTEAIQFFVFTGIFTGLVQMDAKIISDVIPFKEFLKRFTSIFSKENSDSVLLNRCWNFLLLLAQQHFTIDDANALLTTVISTQDETISMASIELLRNLLTENTEALVEFIRERKFFPPFTQLVNAQNEILRIYGVHMMYYIQVKADFFDLKEDLSEEMINAIRLYFHVDQTDLSVNLVLGYLYGIPDHTMKPSKTYKFVYDYKGPIKYPQFLPLLLVMCAYVTGDEVVKIMDHIRNTFLTSEQSCAALVKCSNWQFWIIFSQFLDHKPSEWEKVFNKLFLAKVKSVKHYDPTDDLINLELFCKAVNINSTRIIRGMLIEALENHPTIEILHYAVKFILYVAVDDDDMAVIKKFLVGEVPNLDVIQGFAQRVIMLKLYQKDDFIYTRQTDTDPWPDFSLAIRCVKYITTLDPKKLIKSFPIGVEINYAAISAILMMFISKQSSADSEILVRPLINQFAKCSSKEQLVNPVFVLLDIYSYKCDESDILINLLHTCDKFYEVTTLEVANDVSEGVVQNYTNEIKNTFQQVAKDRNQRFLKNKEVLNKALEFFFKEEEEERTLLDLKQAYAFSVEDMQHENERIIRGNAKFWMRMMKKMHNQVGGPWAKELSEMTHFKFSNYLDLIGRRINTKVNNKFTLHTDASILRDNVKGVESEVEKTIYVENQEPTDTDEPNNRLNTLQIDCRLITATVFIKGTLFIGNGLVAFESSSATDSIGQEVQVQKIIEIGIDQVSFILKRRYLHIDNSAELFTTQNKSYFFVFQNYKNRLQFMKKVKQMKPQNLRFIQFKEAIKFYYEMNLQKRWMSGEVSNFEYIMWLNILSGRSIHDLSQYPVFPWILSDYESETIDLLDEKVYRDLSKPIGALNQERLDNLLFLYNETKDEPISSIYRFHYSTPAYIIGYLIRMEPFTSLHIALQSGKFDHPNRLFSSIPLSWKSVVSKHPDFRELSPEFFSTPDFLYNSNKFDLGILDDKVTRVDDVQLPPWAHNPAEFIAINRMALESKYASEHINQWIDLVFGYASRGINAEKTNNIFHPYSYSNSVTKEVLDDPMELNLIQQHAANFGIVPEQLFQQPHPKRKFVPIPHKLQRTKMCFFETQNIAHIEKSILRFTAGRDNTVWILYSSGEYSQYSLEDMQTAIEQANVKLSIPSDLSTRTLFENHLGLIESKGHVFFTSPLSTSFQLIDVVEKKGRVLYTEAAHAVSITATAVDCVGKEYYAVTAAGDSSIVAWDLEKCCQKCKIVAHTFSIVDVDISVVWRIVASVDSSGMLVMSSLMNGSYIHSIQFDKKPLHVKIAPLGFVVIFFEKHEETLSSTEVVVVDIGGRIIAEKSFEGNMTAFQMIELKDSSCYIVMASDTKFVTIVNVFDLAIKSRGCIMDTADEIEYSKDDGRLLLLTKNRNLLKYEITD